VHLHLRLYHHASAIVADSNICYCQMLLSRDTPLHHSMDAGFRLCNSEGRVGAVLHIYNALRQLKSIDAIPLLDDLCEVFQREIFLGSLPTENFSSHFRRFLGGTVQLEASQTSTNTRQGRRAISLPAKMPSARNYVKRLMPGEMSLFYKLHNERFATTIDFWSRLYTSKPSAALLKSQLEGILPFTKPLTKMNAVVFEEFTGRVPVAATSFHSPLNKPHACTISRMSSCRNRLYSGFQYVE
jgi:hypothetical protein